MPISFHPKPGQVLYCDFRGYIVPEIVKTRPVVIVSPAHLVRPGLVTVVPLSTTPPVPARLYHYRLQGNPIPGSTEVEVWAKCDLFASVSLNRLDRVKLGRGEYRVGAVSMDQVKAIRRACLCALGIDLANPLTYIYGLPHKRKRLSDVLAFWEAPAVVYPASKVDSVVVRADMESASPTRQSLRTAGKLPKELSASIGVG